MFITIAGPLVPYRAGVIGLVAKLRKNGISGVKKARPMMKCHRTVLVMSSCIWNTSPRRELWKGTKTRLLCLSRLSWEVRKTTNQQSSNLLFKSFTAGPFILPPAYGLPSFPKSLIVLLGIFSPFKPTILITSTLVHLLEYITVTIITTAIIAPVTRFLFKDCVWHR